MKTIGSKSTQGLLNWYRNGFGSPNRQNLRLVKLVVKWYEAPFNERASLECKLYNILKKPTLIVSTPLDDAEEYDPILQEKFYKALGRLAFRNADLFSSKDVEQILGHLEQSVSSSKQKHSYRKKVEHLVFVLINILKYRPDWITREDHLAGVLLRSHYITSEVDTRFLGHQLYDFAKEWPDLAVSVLKKGHWQNIANIPDSYLITNPLRDALEHNSSVSEEFCEALRKLSEEHAYLFTPVDAQTVMACLEISGDRNRPCNEGCLANILLGLLKEYPNWAREVPPLDLLAFVLMRYYNTAKISGLVPFAAKLTWAIKLQELLTISPEMAIPILQTEKWLEVAIVGHILWETALPVPMFHEKKPIDIELLRALVETVARISEISSIRFPGISSFDYDLGFLTYLEDKNPLFVSAGDMFEFHPYHGLSPAWRLRYEVVKALRLAFSRFHTTEKKEIALMVVQNDLDIALLRVLVAPHEWLAVLESMYNGSSRGKTYMDKVLELDKKARNEALQVLLMVVSLLEMDRLVALINCIEQVKENKQFIAYDEMQKPGGQEMAKIGLADELFQKQCANLLIDALDHSYERAEKLASASS